MGEGDDGTFFPTFPSNLCLTVFKKSAHSIVLCREVGGKTRRRVENESENLCNLEIFLFSLLDRHFFFSPSSLLGSFKLVTGVLPAGKEDPSHLAGQSAGVKIRAFLY